MGVLFHVIEQLRALLPHRGERRRVRGPGRYHVAIGRWADVSNAWPASLDRHGCRGRGSAEERRGGSRRMYERLTQDIHYGCCL